MKKISGILYFLAFFCMLLIPLATINIQSNVRSEADNRMLAEFPTIQNMTISGLNNYLKDRIGFRRQMMEGYSSLYETAFGEMAHPLYEFGKEGYVFFRMHENIQFNEYHQLFADSVVKMKEYCVQRGVPFYFLFNPEKISVYRQYLPDGIHYEDSWVDQLLAYLEAHGVDCINNKALLTEKSRGEQVFNRQYDAGHWNDLGAFYATNHLWNQMQKDFPAMTEYTSDDFIISTREEAYYPVSVIPVNEIVPVYSLKTKVEDITAKYTGIDLYPGYQYFRYCVNQEDEAAYYPKMLIFHGSYYNRSPMFLMGKVREYIGIHDYQNVLDLDYFFNIFQPEAVVFEVAEYAIEDIYFSQEKMQTLDFNPGISPDETEKILSLAAQPTILDATLLSVQSGEMVDKITWQSPKQMDYVYLLSDDKIFDLLENDDGMYFATVPHDSVRKDAIICCRNKDGEEVCFSVEKGMENI